MNGYLAPEVLDEVFPAITPWMSDEDEAGSIPGIERHRRFQAVAFDLVRQLCPWLLEIVRVAKGQFLIGESAFYVAIPADSADWIEIPELSARLRLLPWTTEGEVPH